jgi:hypothetical protein
MSGSTFTNDQYLELQTAGQADWDSSNNANFAILERGYHIKAQAGSAISSGQVCTVGSGGLIWPLNANSMSNVPQVISYKSVSSGDQTQFIRRGIVRSMTVWSGNIIPGEDVFVSVASPGFCVKSFYGAGHSAGIALNHTSIMFDPGARSFPDYVTHVATIGPVVVGSNGVFAAPLGYRGTTREIITVSSHDRLRVEFWSGSSNVSSELIYQTTTRSWSGTSADITSTYYRDRAYWPYTNTDASTRSFIYGKVTAQSGSGVTSAYVSVSIISERLR